MPKTETGTYATKRALRQRTLRYLLRPQVPGAIGSGAEYEFQQLFSTGSITGEAKTVHEVVARLVGNSQTIDHQTGRSTRGTVVAELIDGAGTLLRYMSSPTCTLKTTIAASGGITQIDCQDASNMLGFPTTGTVLIGSERFRYTARDNTGAKKFTGVTRAVDGTTAAAHAIGDAIENGEQLRAGTRVKVFAGYDDISVGDYMQLGRYEILDRDLPDGVTWRLTMGDVQMLLNQDVFTSASQEKPLALYGDPVIIALWVLSSTGTPGSNGAYDGLPKEFGVGLDQAWIDIAGLEALRTTFSAVQLDFLIDKPWNVWEWLQTQVWAPIGCVPFVTNSGKYSAKFIDPLPTSAVSIDTLTRDDITSWRWMGGDRMVRNIVEVQFDYGLPEAPGRYSTRQRFTAEDSVARYGKRPPLAFTFEGVRTAGRLSSGSTYDAPNTLIKDSLVTRMFQRWATAKPLLAVTAQYRKHHLEPGDVVTLTHADIPNLLAGARGLTAEVMQVLDYSPGYGREAGMQFTLATITQVPVTTSAVTAEAPVDLQNRYGPTAPTGLEIPGQGLDTNFAGPDAVVVWRQSVGDPDLIIRGLDESTTLDPRHLDWVVEVLDPAIVWPAPGSVRRTEFVQTPAYSYTLAKNQEDSLLLTGGPTPVRSVTMRVSERYRDGVVGPSASITVTNPAPSMAGFTPTVAVGPRGLTVDWSGYTVVDADLSMFEVRFGPTTPPTPVLGEYAAPTAYAETLDTTLLSAARTQYVQIIPHDAFGGGTGSGVATVTDNAPSMVGITPIVSLGPRGLTVDWSAYAAPGDITGYRVLVDTVSPPVAVLGDFGGTTTYTETLDTAILSAGRTQYVQVIPYDLFGAGTGSNVASFTDTAPTMAGFSPTVRAVVNGLEIDWSAFAAPSDLAKFEVRIGTSSPPTVVLGYFGTDTTKCETAQISGTILAPGTTYYVQVIPHDLLGAGTGSTIVTGVPVSPADQWGGLFNRVATFDGKVSAEQDGAGAFTNKLVWTSGTLRYVDGAGVSQSASIATTGSPATWSSGNLYLYYIFGQTQFQTTTSLTTALGADRIIIAIYAGGSTLHVPMGNFFVAGGDVYARTIAANQLVASAAVVTGTAQIQDAIITRLKIINGEISNSAAIHGSTSWSADNTEREIASAALTTTGGSVFFAAACSNRGPAGDSIEWRIYRDAAPPLRASLYGLYQPSVNDAVHVGLLEIDSPPAGTYTYRVKAVRIGGAGSGTQEAATDAFVLEVRR